MKGYLLKLAVLIAIGAASGFAHSLAAPFRLEPDAPPAQTIQLGDAGTDASTTAGTESGSDTGSATGSGLESEQAHEADPEPTPQAGSEPSADAPDAIVLDSLEIDLTTARLLFENGLADFVDARIASEFEAGHIEGAYHITPAMLASGSPAAIDFLRTDTPIVIYCGGGDCDDSKLVAERLQRLFFFEQTHIMTDGFPAWAEADLPVGTGPDPFAE
ncbi:MAG: rhodanese-like domain-containing protein [Planctomycetota bacterium]